MRLFLPLAKSDRSLRDGVASGSSSPLGSATIAPAVLFELCHGEAEEIAPGRADLMNVQWKIGS